MIFAWPGVWFCLETVVPSGPFAGGVWSVEAVKLLERRYVWREAMRNFCFLPVSRLVSVHLYESRNRQLGKYETIGTTLSRDTLLPGKEVDMIPFPCFQQPHSMSISSSELLGQSKCSNSLST